MTKVFIGSKIYLTSTIKGGNHEQRMEFQTRTNILGSTSESNVICSIHIYNDRRYICFGCNLSVVGCLIMTYETYYDKYSEKEIHFTLFPADTVFEPTIEIHSVWTDPDTECDWTDEEEEEWTDRILAIINSGGVTS